MALDFPIEIIQKLLTHLSSLASNLASNTFFISKALRVLRFSYIRNWNKVKSAKHIKNTEIQNSWKRTSSISTRVSANRFSISAI